MSQLIVASSRPEDSVFGSLAAENAGIPIVMAFTTIQLKEALRAYPRSVVLWDVDHPKATAGNDPTSVQSIGQVLMKETKPERVFALSSDSLHATPYIYNMPCFGHHLFRVSDPVAPKIAGYLFRAALHQKPFGLEHYAPDVKDVHRLTLRKSSSRQAACQALTTILGKKRLPPKLLTLLIGATDELLMNAIYDAPINGETRYRRTTSRTEIFEFKAKEEITVEAYYGPDYGAILVADQFGSLERSHVLSFIRKDYEKTEYKPNRTSDEPNAGLGVYGMLKSGLSLCFISRPRIRTDVILFFPMVKNFKSFRSSFRFFSFL